MEIQQQNQSPNFGWKQGVHRRVSRRFATELNEFLPEGKKIEVDSFVKSVLDVDKEIGEGRLNEHFADIANPKQGDAVSAFKLNFECAIKAHNVGVMPERDNYLARAFHFLQDSLCAVHIKPFASPMDKNLRKTHQKFEELGNFMISTFVDNQVPVETSKSKNLDVQNAFVSKTYNKMLKKNKSLSKLLEKGKIALPLAVSEALNNTLKMTKMFAHNFLANVR